MSNVIGPIAYDDWYLMRMLRESIKIMRSSGLPKYQMNINRQQQTYNSCLRDAVAR